MKILLTSFFLLIQFLVFSNMANPVRYGTLGAAPFLNTHVSVQHEDLNIQLNQGFKTADYNIKYYILAEKDSLQIPFLFYASEYMEGFTVTIDGETVDVKPVPEEYSVPEGSKFSDFAYFFETAYADRHNVLLKDSDNGGFYIDMRDMLYFEADITPGEHVIEVNYTAKAFVDHSDWIKAYSFRYALSPAKYWKSFGTLKITVDATAIPDSVTTNVGKPDSGSLRSIAVWNFDGLPANVFNIIFVPLVSDFTKELIDVEPGGWTALFTVLLIVLHILLMRRFRNESGNKRGSIIAFAGVIIIPIISMVFWFNCYDLIDYAIGEHASRSHGYFFLWIVMFPIFLLVYWLMIYVLNRDFNKKRK